MLSPHVSPQPQSRRGSEIEWDVHILRVADQRRFGSFSMIEDEDGSCFLGSGDCLDGPCESVATVYIRLDDDGDDDEQLVVSCSVLHEPLPFLYRTGPEAEWETVSPGTCRGVDVNTEICLSLAPSKGCTFHMAWGVLAPLDQPLL